MEVKEITVTHLFEGFKSGNKYSHFVSIKSSLDSSEDIIKQQFKLKKLAVQSCLMDAVMCGDITAEQYNENIEMLVNNYRVLTEGK